MKVRLIIQYSKHIPVSGIKSKLYTCTYIVRMYIVLTAKFVLSDFNEKSLNKFKRVNIAVPMKQI